MSGEVLSFQVVETFLDGPVNFLSWITDMEAVPQGEGFRLFTATRPGGGILSIDVGTTMTLADLEAIPSGFAVPVAAHIERVVLGGTETLWITGANAERISGYRISADGDISAAAQIDGSPQGAISAEERVTLGADTFVYTARLGDGGITTSRLLPDGTMTEVARLPLGADWQGVDVPDMATLRLGDATYLLALSVRQAGVISFAIGADGSLSPASTLGAAGGLGLAAPSAIEVVQLGGTSYALVAGAGSSSISVVAVGAGGALTLTDHVVDSLDTRFQGVQAMATVSLGDRVFVVAGGGDGGLNLFTLLPGGRMRLMATGLHAPGLALDHISAISAVAKGGLIEVFVAGEGAGITRLKVDPGALAPIRTGGATADHLTGDTRGDLLSGGTGNDTLDGGAGRDILVDGAGTDRLTGGGGADVFVLSGDGATDTITDFESGLDHLDLTAWGRVYALEALEFLTTGTGATIRFGAEYLVLQSADGAPIDRSTFTSADLFPLWHVATGSVAAGARIEGTAGADTQTGGAGDDVLVGSPGADRIDGGAGFDMADYSQATGSQRIDLMATSLNTNLAAGDVHLSIEGLIGGLGADNLRGTLGDNILRGGGNVDWLFGRRGNDLLDGGVGDDVLLGGLGQDTLNGGANRDRAQYSESLSGLTVDLQFPERNTGEAVGDAYLSVEDLAGSSYDDFLFGDAGANRLFGRDGHDALSGRGGADYLNGGAGRDTLDGGTANDTLRGGTHGDTFIFNGGADRIEDFRLTDGDRLQLNDTVFGPGWDRDDLMDSFAHVQDNSVVIDFGFGNSIEVEGINSISALVGVVDII